MEEDENNLEAELKELRARQFMVVQQLSKLTYPVDNLFQILRKQLYPNGRTLYMRERQAAKRIKRPLNRMFMLF